MTTPLALLTAAILAVAAALLNLPEALGAHPFWGDSVVWIGAPVGLIVALLLRRAPRLPAALVLAVLTAGALAAAYWGKTRFAASFAEDALAGQVWYFGWIATAGVATALVATAAMRRRVATAR